MAEGVILANEVIDWTLKQIERNYPDSVYLEELATWKSGQKYPTFRQIEELSRSTHIPLGYFFLKQAPCEDIPLLRYRSKVNGDVGSRELVDTIDDMETIIEWSRENMKSEGMEKNSLVGACSGSHDKYAIAERIRAVLGLNLNWFQGLKNAEEAFRVVRERVSSSGVYVMMNGIVGNNTHRPLNLDEFRAFTIVDEYAPLIFINAVDSSNGRLFSLLHEYTHILLGVNDLHDSEEFGSCDETEVLCNAVAAELLVPDFEFRAVWNCSVSNGLSGLEVLRECSAHFKCSKVVLARKALDQKLISKTVYDQISLEAMNQYRESQKRSGGNYYLTMKSRIDGRFFESLWTSVCNGMTQYTEAFKLTHTNRNTFFKLAERYS